MRNLNQKKPLSMTMSALMTFTTCHSVSVFASDIEIYKSLTSGKTSILLMLDTSGSMGISSLVLPKTNQYGSPGDVEASLCSRVAVSEYYSNRSTANMYEWTYNLKDTRSFSPTYNKTSIYKTVTIGTTTIPYYVRGCTNGTLTEYDRLSRLKDAIIPLLASNDLSDDVIMGLGQFSSKTELTIGTASNRLTDGHSGRILVPNMALTQAQRIKIAQQIAAVKSLDTTTNEDGSANANLKLSSNSYPNVTKSSSGTPTAQAYAEAGAYMMGTGTGSSGTNSGKVSTIYDGYMVKQQADNDGQVYFICVELGTSTTSALGATVKQCVNSWPGYDSTNKTASSGTSIYKPNGNGGWTSVSATTLKNTVGSMSRLWDVYTKLPVGWRFGGWMKVDNEPMDIEPIVGTIWGYGDNIRGLVSYRTNPFSVDGSTDSLIGGFAYSASDTKNGIVYKAGGSTSSCDGNGIYFLTDGAPNSTKDTMAQTIMNTTLTSSYAFSGKPSGTGVLVSPTLKSNLFSGETGGWEYIGEYAKKLFDKTKNPKSMQIKTAVVGFGSSFSGIPKNTDGSYNCDAVKDTNLDAYNACKWGGTDFGNGGFYYAENSADIKNSIINFVKNVTPTFDPVLTGSPTLPQDALNPLRIQPYAYYASFTPKPQESTQLWAGNMNKYHVLNGQLYAANKSTQLFNTDGSLNQSADGIWTGGVKGQLPLGIQLNTDNIQVASRTIYTNREITGSAPYTASEIDSLKKVNLQNVFAIDPSGTALFANDPAKNYWLNLLGYNVTTDETVALSDLVNKAELRQVGSVMHSTPVLLTQEGKITTTSGQLNTTDRKDYLLFGTTQGLLHVVDATTGKEIFAFVPNEMMQNQPKAFLSESSSSGGSSNLYYGIDAPWTAHTQYVAKADGTLTVNDSGRTVTDSTSGDEIALKGLQWVYGGLRMGGRSYYALDLSDLTNPKLKFHINPDGAINADKTPNTDNALSYMGQSWSKPTIAYVNFGGKKKLVMFVGGGYDAGYENPAYDQTNNKGAGVYMFDANNGDLLWWSSANASADKGAQAHTENSDLKYSVVSQINAVDRDSDGLVDHLYFGDLGGQAFRIDLNNNATGDNAAAKKGNFVTHVVRLLNQHVNNDGTSPRFYEMPSFSVHHADSGLLGVVALSSGNRSSPLSGVVGTNNPTPSTSASDGVFVIFDKDVANANLYSLADADLKTKDVALASLNAYFTNKFTGDAYKNGVDIATKNGWKYTYSDSAGVYKGMNGLYALDGMLYVNVFYRDGDGIGGSCGAGVKGNSKLYQFCLPTGKCSFYGSSTTQPNNTDLGAGILGTALGNATSNNGQTLLQNVVKKTDNFCTDANKNSPECQLFNTTAKLQNLRWYETR
ncbi:PilC/PilY family type IV pilus protein [Acinetobacter baumannii]